MTEAERCEAALRRAILTGELAPGERLPPERALAESLGVNRTTLRAALGRIASAGLLTVRQGSGYVVQDFRRHAGLEVLAELAELAEERGEVPIALYRDVLEVRRRLAEMALTRIASRADELDLSRLTARVDAFARLATDGADPRAFAEADVECTAAILELTGSDVMGLLLNPIRTVLTRLPRLREVMYCAPTSNVAGYRALIAWLAARETATLPLVLAQLEARDAANLEALSGST